MPIEFICPACQTRLRVPDDAAGQTAQCPTCGGQSEIPLPPPPVPPTSRTTDPVNPLDDTGAQEEVFSAYAAPPTASESFYPDVESGPIQPRQVRIAEICRGTFQVVRERIGQTALLGASTFAMAIILQFVLLFLTALLNALAENNAVAGAIAYIVMMLTMSVAQVFLMAFVIKASINLAKYGDLRLNELPQVIGQVPSVIAIYVGLTILGMLGMMAGVFLVGALRFFLPPGDLGDLVAGIALLPVMLAVTIGMMRLVFAIHFVLDQKMSAGTALGHSLAYTKGNVLALFVAGVAIYLVAAILTLLTLFIGAVVTLPSLLIAMSVAYLLISSQRLALASANPLSVNDAV